MFFDELFHPLVLPNLYLSSNRWSITIFTEKTLTNYTQCNANPFHSTNFIIFYFYLGFLLRTFTIHKTEGDGGGLVISNLACSLVVSDLHLETKGSQLESGYWLCAEVSSLQ